MPVRQNVSVSISVNRVAEKTYHSRAEGLWSEVSNSFTCARGGFGGRFGVSGVLSVSWISGLCPSALSLSYPVCGVLAPLLMIRSISHITLESVSTEVDSAKASRHTFPNFRVTSSQIHRDHHTLSSDCGLQQFAHIETVVG